MPKHICNGCNKIYDHKGSYIRHINKKKPCEFIVDEEPKLEAPELPQEIIPNLDPNSEVKHMPIDNVELFGQIQPIPIIDINNVVKNDKPVYECSYCNNTFTKANNLSRHYKTCPKKDTFDKSQIEAGKIELLRKQLESKDREIENRDKQIEYLKTLISGAGSIIKISVN